MDDNEYCPKCGHEGTQVYAFGTEPDDEDLNDMSVGKFGCTKCGHEWTVDWMARDLERQWEEDHIEWEDDDELELDYGQIEEDM